MGEPAILGWFLDNEMRWGPDWRGTETLIQLYLALPADAPGKRAAVDWLLGELGDVAAVNTTLGAAFADRDAMLAATAWSSLVLGDAATEVLVRGWVAEAASRYFEVTTTAVRAVDPDHLLLGNREVSVMTPAEVYVAAGAWLDVVSINNYVFADGIAELALVLSGGLDPADGFAAQHELAPRPILIGEFGFRADDSGLPNSWPPQYPTYATQADRAQAYRDYVASYQDIPWVVGWHWFEWVDQPAEGRFDGEDNNWGLVNEQDEVYPEITEAMTEENRRAMEGAAIEVGG